MGSAQQEDRSDAPISRRWHLVSRLAIGLATLLLLFIASYYHLARVDTLLNSHRIHLELQRVELDQHAEIVRRSLQELLERSALDLVDVKSAPPAEPIDADVIVNEHELSARGFLESIGLGGAASGLSGAAGAAPAKAGGGITGALSGLLPNISTAGIEDSLVVPSKYLGVGIASGALKGMNMPVKIIDTSIDPKPSGLNGIAENFGSSVTSTLVASTASNSTTSTSSQNLTALLDGSNGMVGQAVLALSQGIGSGTASGLKLNDKPVGTTPPAYNTSGANGIAGNFGNGLTTTFFGGIDLQKLSGGAAAPAAPGAPALTPRQVARAALPDLNALLDGSNGLVGQAALALTQGIGSGTATGLKLNDKKGAAPIYDTNGINGVVGNVGNGLTSSFFDGLDIQKLTAVAGMTQGGQKLTARQAATTVLDGSNGMVGQAVLALSQGIGSGTATGLKLNNRKAGDAPVYDTTGANGVAGNVGNGLTSSFFDGLDIDKLKSILNPTAGAAKVNARQMATMANSLLSDPATLSMLAQAAAGIGIGLGSGTAVGLGLQEESTLLTSMKAANGGGAMDGVQQITQNFASGITSSFLMGGTVQKLKAAVAPGGSLAGLLPNNTGGSNPFPNLKLNQVAQGFAVGLVAGAGSVIPQTKIFKADTRSFNDSVDGTSLGLGQGFGQGGAFLISKLLNMKGTTPPPGIGVTNSTGATAGATDPLLTSVLAGSVGAGSSPAAAPASPPGFDATAPASLANDQAPAPASIPAAQAASAVDPAAAVVTNPLLVSTLSGGTLQNPAAPAAAPAATPAADPASAAAPALDVGLDAAAPAVTAKRRFLQARSKKIIVRQSTDASPDLASLGGSLGLNLPGGTTNATDIQGVVSSTDASKISPMIQMGVNDLTCVGIGGLAAIGFGLFESGTINLNQFPKSNFTKPDTTFQIVSDGNTYEANPATKVVTVNGVPIVRFIVLLVFHVLLGLGVYFTMIPLLLGLHSRRNINAYFGGPLNLMPKSQKIMSYSVYPLALLILIFGLISRGNATHFSTVHGGLGLVTIIQTTAAGGFALALAGPLKNSPKSPVRLAQKANFALFIGLSQFLLATGFADISTLTLCALQTIAPTSMVILTGLGIMTPILILQGTLMTEMFVKKRGQAIVLGNDMESNARIVDEKQAHILEIGKPHQMERE